MDSEEELTQAASDLRTAITSDKEDIWEHILAKHEGSLPKLVNAVDESQRTALLCAVVSGRHRAARKLLDIEGLKIDAEDSMKRTALTWAVAKFAEETSQLLLEKKANVNHLDRDGKTPLSLTVGNSYEGESLISKMTLLLLSRNDIDKEHKDKNGRTPLSLAVAAGNVGATRHLLEHGALVNAQDQDGRTPLSWAVSARTASKSIWLNVDLLLKHGADPECQDNSTPPKTPISYALLPEIALRLVSHRIRRRLIVCCDGTWNDQSLKQPITNVSRILSCLEAVDEREGQRFEQIPFYVDGIGTGKRIEKTWDGMTGEGINLKICEAYRLLCSAYTSNRDQIVLVGFSRGSYTIQCVAKLINDIGLLRKDVAVTRLPQIFDAWAHGDGSDPFEGYEPGESNSSELQEEIPEKGKRIDLKKTCQGLFKAGLIRRGIKIYAYAAWDTVKALDKGKFPFLNEQLPPNIDHAFHALALDEERVHFLPLTLTFGGSTQPKQFKQCWFRGTHSDIGGGNNNTGLANITLCWMISNLERLVQFDESACCDATNDGKILKVDMAKANKDVPEIVDLEIYDSMTKRYQVAKPFYRPGVRNVGKTPEHELIHFTVRYLKDIPGVQRSKSQPLVDFKVSEIAADPSRETEPHCEWQRRSGLKGLMNRSVVIREDPLHVYERAMLEAWMSRDSAFANEVKHVLPLENSAAAGPSSSVAGGARHPLPPEDSGAAPPLSPGASEGSPGGSGAARSSSSVANEFKKPLPSEDSAAARVSAPARRKRDRLLATLSSLRRRPRATV